MSNLERGDLERVGRSFSFLVWILVLAALGILFGSCTASNSPSPLYFFKVTDIYSFLLATSDFKLIKCAVASSI